MPSIRIKRKRQTIIACGVFRFSLDYLRLSHRFPHVRVRYLPPNLHMNPRLLEIRLIKEMNAAVKRGERITCLYGDCFPGIGECCERFGAVKARGCHCYEMLLGGAQFQKLIDETAGTFFLERELITDFERCCSEPLELYDEEMRKEFFKHYKKLVYVRQPADPDLGPRATELARFLELALEIRDSDYSHLERELKDLIQKELI